MKDSAQIHVSNYGILNKASLLFAAAAFLVTLANVASRYSLLPMAVPGALWLASAVINGLAGWSARQAGEERWRNAILPTASYSTAAAVCLFYPFPA